MSGVLTARVVCNGCGDHLASETMGLTQLRAFLRSQGWRVRIRTALDVAGIRDLCPVCVAVK